MTRTEAVSVLWAYIKQHGLHDSEDPRFVNADEALTQVFRGQERVSLFDMTGLIGRYLKPAKEDDAAETSSTAPREEHGGSVSD